MSLRAQIHDAVDEIAVPVPDLEQRIAGFVLSDEKDRRVLPGRTGESEWKRRFRGATGLVAAALILVLVSGLFVAGRIWRDINAPPASINQAALKSLEGRSMQFVPVPAGGQCPVTPAQLYPLGMGVGNGPIALIDKEAQPSTSSGAWAVYSFAIYPYQSGLFLIRAADLERNTPVVFAKSPLGPSLIVPTGRILGTDEISGRSVEMHSEAVFQLGTPASQNTKQSPFRYPPLFIMVGVKATGSHCIGFQFDGSSFTETIVVDFSSYGL